MNDKELADAAHRVVGDVTGYDDIASDYVRDWRVAGALMEKVQDEDFTWFCLDDGGKDSPKWCICDGLANDVASNKSLPRAIIEACVEALK